MSEMLQQAREYEKAGSVKIPAEQRPSFHVTPLVGWCNDPNGFSVFQGEYHLFHQYYPYATEWGPMHWAHWKTKDFIRWEALPCALAPDMPYDRQGVFSGSGIEWNGKHYLIYTSVSEENGEPRQTQSVAVGDGVNYEKLPINPVITADQLPKGSSRIDFRDPKIWREGDTFYMITGSRSSDGSGQLPVFTSKDLEHWEFVTILDRCNNRYGKMWECPDFFELDGKGVVLTSPQEMQAEGLIFHNGNGSLCLIGSYDRSSHDFVREQAQPIDYGMDFYAPQTMDIPDGRRIMIAWMRNWENHMTPPGYKWSGFMTLPRELRVKNGKLYQVPVRELESYYTAAYSHNAVKAIGYTELTEVTGRVFDMTVEFSPAECKELEICVAGNERFYTSLRYDGNAGTFTTDRTYSGCPQDRLQSRTMELPERKGKVVLRIIMDQYGIEVFANDGEQVMTSLTYAPLEYDRIFFKSKGPFDVLFHKIQEDINKI